MATVANRLIAVVGVRLLPTDSVEKVSFSGSLPIKCAAVEMAASHFKLPSGVSLSVLAPV